MSYTVIEWSALSLIVIIILKVVIVFLAPTVMITIIKKMLPYKRWAAVISGSLAVWLFLQFVNAGLSVVTLLAITLWVSLVVGMGMYKYLKDYIEWIEQKGLSTLIKHSWVYILIWLVLASLGLKELVS